LIASTSTFHSSFFSTTSPARAVGLERLLDYMMKQDGVWITRRLDIARHWIKTHPYPGKGLNEEDTGARPGPSTTGRARRGRVPRPRSVPVGKHRARAVSARS
jgi:hypothetical protein